MITALAFRCSLRPGSHSATFPVMPLYISNHKTSIIKCITRKVEAPRLFSHLDQTAQLSKPYSLPNNIVLENFLCHIIF